MDVKDFENIIGKIKKYTDYVYLHVKGEPLIHPNLCKIIDICNQNNLKVNISTNGTILNEKVDALKGVRQINISLHSFEKTEGVKTYLENVLKAADELTKSGVIIRYKLWNDEVKDNSKLIKLLNEKYSSKIKEEHTKDIKKDIKLEDNVYLSIKKPFKWPDEYETFEDCIGTCYGLRKQIAILVDGTVTPCCMDNDGVINLGNILSCDLESILSSKKAQDIINGFENNKCVEKLCRRCTYKNTVT